MDRASTESATLKAVWIGRRGTSSSSRSFGIVMTVSMDCRSFSSPHAAFSARTSPSLANGRVQTAIVSASPPLVSFAS